MIPMETTHKYALVTGASSGIGREYARQLAARGYALVLVSDREQENRLAAREIGRQSGAPVLPLCFDLSDTASAQRLIDRIEELQLDIRIVVCNAGALLFGGFPSADPDRIARTIALHCTVPSLLCRYFAAKMRGREGGRILLMSSATAWMPYPSIAVYAATKSYLKSFSDALHDELRRNGVTVTAVYPGAVDTPFFRLDAVWRRRLASAGVLLTPEQVARKGLQALFRGRKRCIPGLFAKCCVLVCRILPSCLIRALLRIPAVARLLE